MPNIIIGKEEAFSKGFFFTDGVEQNINLSNASFSGTSFSVGNEDSDPFGLAFNGDGTKMFVIGIASGSVHEYDLGTNFDLSTASYSGTSFDVEDTIPTGVQFNDDGTKMFVVGANDDTIDEYDLTTGFDVSTASFSGTSFDVSSEDSIPQGLAFNDDGTKMFVVGENNGTIYRYDLTTGFDISTASYSGTSFDVSSEEGSPRGIEFGGNGSNMFVIGTASGSVHEYDLDTGFDLSTAGFSDTSFDVSSEDGGPRKVTFNGDGTKMFVVGFNNENIYEYTL